MTNYRMVKESTAVAVDPRDNKATWTPTGETFAAATPEDAQAVVDAKRRKYPERGCYGCEAVGP
jgi:hypothetical protein